MKKLLTLFGLIPILLFGQTPTMRQVANAGTAITRLPVTATATVAATDTMMVFKGGVWKKTTISAIGATAPTTTVVAGSNISVTSGVNSYTVANTAPNQTVTLTGAGTTTVSGTYPTYTVTGAASGLTVGTTAIASGTEGALLFEGAGNVLQEDATQLFWDNTDNELGIGTVTPSARLHVIGTGTTSVTYALSVHNATGTNNSLLINNAGHVSLVSTPSANARFSITDNEANTDGIMSLYGSNNAKIFQVQNTSSTGMAIYGYSAGNYGMQMLVDKAGSIGIQGRADGSGGVGILGICHAVGGKGIQAFSTSTTGKALEVWPAGNGTIGADIGNFAEDVDVQLIKARWARTTTSTVMTRDLVFINRALNAVIGAGDHTGSMLRIYDESAAITTGNLLSISRLVGSEVNMFTITNQGGIDVLDSINTTAGDAATINATAGRFRKDASGTIFTLTSNKIDVNSIILLTPITAGLTGGKYLTVQAGSGSAVITFEDIATGVATAPSANMDINFLIIN